MSRARPRAADDLPESVPARVWAMGLTVAFGTAIGLRLLLRGAAESEPDTAWLAGSNLPLAEAACWVIGALLGGTLTGAGRPRVLARALLFALAIGAGTAAFEHYGLHEPPDDRLAVLGGVTAASSLIGAGLGRLVWRPLPPLPEVAIGSAPVPMGEVTLSIPTNLSPAFRLRIGWIQLFIAAAIVVTVVMRMESIQATVVRALKASGQTRSSFAAWAMASLLAFLGGMVAGANRRHVAHQALALWGVVAVLVPIAVLATGREKLVAYEFLISDGGLKFIGSNPVLLGVFAGLVSGGLAALGAWIGADVFPPLSKKPRSGPTDM